MSLALAPAGQQRVQDLVRARPEGMQRVRRCLRRGSDWRSLEIVAARCGMAIGTVRDQPDRWRCAEPGSVKDPKVSAFNAAKRAAAERELDALAERIYGLLEATALLARGTIARRLCAPPWRIALALERLLSSGEVVAFGQRFAIARRPHRPTAAERAAAGRLEELDAAVLASLDAILTRERRCYVTAGELQVATGLSRYYLRRCLLRLTQRADPLGPDPHVVRSRLRTRGRPWAYLRRPLDRNALLACMPRDGWFDLGQVMSFQDPRGDRWLSGLVDTGALEISPPRRPDARPQPIFPGDAFTTEAGRTQPLIDESCRARFTERGQQLASSVASHHPLPGHQLISVRRQELAHDLLDHLVRSGPASLTQLRAAGHHGAFRSLLDGLVADGAVEAISGPDGTRRYRASRFGLYVLAVAAEERRLAPPGRRTAQGGPAIGTIRVTPMLRAVRQIRNGAPAPSWFVPAEVWATAPRLVGMRSPA